MKNAPMRFGGFSFHHNPSKLKIEDVNNILRVESPCAEPDSIMLGSRLRRISGEGELYGADCIEQYRALCGIVKEGRKGLLSLPHMPPVYAYLTELRLIAEPDENVLGFAFSFIEAKGEAVSVTPESVYTVSVDGESLWDIAYAHGLGIDELVALNPQIRFIDSLDAGEEVRVC